jgi:hypothetical protein
MGDGFERPVATLQQHASGVDTGTLDEFVRRDPVSLTKCRARLRDWWMNDC